MINDLKYTVRSREIVDLVSAMRASRLTLSPYFQRNLVWREAHKRDFIDTILKGFPFPQIFLARGPINLDTMEASQCVVDGQQRLNTIKDFTSGKLDFEGRLFSELSARQREEFLKYEVPIIDFDLDAGDPRLKDVFHRLNRTYYSLSAIEKISSEYSASEFLLVARVLCGEITNDELDADEFADVNSDESDVEPIESNPFSRDPGINPETWVWLLERADGPFARVIRNNNIFTSFEFDRKLPLMFTLNLMCSYLFGYYNRNDKVRRYLDERSQEFPERTDVIEALNFAGACVEEMRLPTDSMWWNKANFFTLVVELSRASDFRHLSYLHAAKALKELSLHLSSDYILAAREAVGRKGNRELRGIAVRSALYEALQGQ